MGVPYYSSTPTSLRGYLVATESLCIVISGLMACVSGMDIATYSIVQLLDPPIIYIHVTCTVQLTCNFTSECE